MYKRSLKGNLQRSKRSLKTTRLYEDEVIKLKTLKTRRMMMMNKRKTTPQKMKKKNIALKSNEERKTNIEEELNLIARNMKRFYKISKKYEKGTRAKDESKKKKGKKSAFETSSSDDKEAANQDTEEASKKALMRQMVIDEAKANSTKSEEANEVVIFVNFCYKNLLDEFEELFHEYKSLANKYEN
ncbi:hypothetical protein M9H77_08521 [Catharanthus roseus]|uniref:Uncharacterized protein n=1 Tax=Catharanthus roseus TaxID=4058 RepID=A0ACC0BY70_CATRO|nr:hypothetical protein M9H77_08521 [Catharanthus roseus]